MTGPLPDGSLRNDSGKLMYEIWRHQMNSNGRGNRPEPRWKDLKPWLRKAWNATARELNDSAS